MEKKVKYKIKSKGLGTKQKYPPLTVRMPPEIDAVVRSLPERSEFMREAIIEKLEREGLWHCDRSRVISRSRED